MSKVREFFFFLIDNDGNYYWIYFCSLFRRKKLIETIDLPAELVCAVTFGCKHSKTLYALTGVDPINGQNGQPLNIPVSKYEGKIYAIEDLPYRGCCGTRARI